MFVKVSHGEVTTGSDYYLRHSDTAINTFEHVVVQMAMSRRGSKKVYLVPLCYRLRLIVSVVSCVLARLRGFTSLVRDIIKHPSKKLKCISSKSVSGCDWLKEAQAENPGSGRGIEQTKRKSWCPDVEW